MMLTEATMTRTKSIEGTFCNRHPLCRKRKEPRRYPRLTIVFRCPHHLGRGLYLQLRRLDQIRLYLSFDSAKKFAVAFILSRLDYCNALLMGIPDEKVNKLQRIQNSAARLVMRKSKHDSVIVLLRRLNWLPVKARIEYKVALLCHQQRRS